MTPGQIEALRRRRDELLERKPPHDALIAEVIYVWHLLDSERSIGMDVGPIPWSAVVAWCDRQPHIDDELTTIFVEAINYLDADRQRRRAAKQNAATKPGPRSK